MATDLNRRGFFGAIAAAAVSGAVVPMPTAERTVRIEASVFGLEATDVQRLVDAIAPCLPIGQAETIRGRVTPFRFPIYEKAEPEDAA